MNKPKKKEIVHPGLNQDAAEKFKVLGDPTRLRIVQYLLWREKQNATAESDAKPGPASVGDVAEFVSGDKKVTANVSHQVKELRHAGLIIMERSGKQKFCSLDHGVLQMLAGILGISGEAAAPDPASPNRHPTVNGLETAQSVAPPAAESDGTDGKMATVGDTAGANVTADGSPSDNGATDGAFGNRGIVPVENAPEGSAETGDGAVSISEPIIGAILDATPEPAAVKNGANRRRKSES